MLQLFYSFDFSSSIFSIKLCQKFAPLKSHIAPPQTMATKNPRNNMTNALIELRDQVNGSGDNQKILPLCQEISAKYGVSAEGLRQSFYRKESIESQMLSANQSSRLSLFQELMLVGTLKATATGGGNVYLSYLPTLVETLFDQQVDGSWARRFLQRYNSCLAPTTKKTMEANRKNGLILEATEIFVVAFEKMLGTWKLKNKPQSILTCDETLLNVTDGKLVATRIKSAHTKCEPTDTRPPLYGSMLTFVAADGTFWLCAICICIKDAKATVNVPVFPTASRESNAPLKVVMLTSDSGYFQREHYEECVRTLLMLFAEHGVSTSPKALLADNLGIHRSPQLVRECMDKKLQLCALAPNCTAFMAPLDNEIFASFKMSLARNVKDIQSENALSGDSPVPTGALIPASLSAALAAGFKKGIIIQSFRNTGIFPWNGEKIKQNATAYCDLPPATSSPTLDQFSDKAVDLVQKLVSSTQEKKKQFKTRVQRMPLASIDPQSNLKKGTVTEKYIREKLVTPENYLAYESKVSKGREQREQDQETRTLSGKKRANETENETFLGKIWKAMKFQ